MDVIPPQREPGTAAVKLLAEDSRKHAGNIRHDVLVQTTAPTFTVVECWKTQAFDGHVGRRRARHSARNASMTGALTTNGSTRRSISCVEQTNGRTDRLFSFEPPKLAA